MTTSDGRDARPHRRHENGRVERHEATAVLNSQGQKMDIRQLPGARDAPAVHHRIIQRADAVRQEPVIRFRNRRPQPHHGVGNAERVRIRRLRCARSGSASSGQDAQPWWILPASQVSAAALCVWFSSSTATGTFTSSRPTGTDATQTQDAPKPSHSLTSLDNPVDDTIRKTGRAFHRPHRATLRRARFPQQKPRLAVIPAGRAARLSSITADRPPSSLISHTGGPTSHQPHGSGVSARVRPAAPRRWPS